MKANIPIHTRHIPEEFNRKLCRVSDYIELP